ncbi:MAG: hypothetical protein ACOY3Z_09065 [Thermodesulfobacteriota bacterium]
MKKGVLACMTVWQLLFGATAFAGEYDGIWITPGSPWFYQVYSNGNTLIFTEIDSDFLTCDVLVGALQGNLGTVQFMTDADGSNCQFTVEFTSATTGAYTVTSCTRLHNLPPIGTSVSIQKLL